MDPNRQKYTLVQTVQSWEETHNERVKLLSKREKKKKSITLEKYSRSFPCLCSPYAILLLEIDFQKLIEEYVMTILIRKDNVIENTSLFSEKWTNLAEKVLILSKKSRIPEVKEFLSTHEDLITAGTHNSILGLFLLPLCIKTNQSGKNKDSFTKQEIKDCFILHAEVPQNVDEVQDKFENWVQKTNTELFPYFLCSGKLENTQFYVVLNKER